MESHHKGLRGENKGQCGQVETREVSSLSKKDIFYSENSHWNNFPRDVVESPSLEDLKMQLGQLERAVDNLISALLP